MTKGGYENLSRSLGGGVRKFIELTRGGGMFPVMQDKKIFL